MTSPAKIAATVATPGAAPDRAVVSARRAPGAMRFGMALLPPASLDDSIPIGAYVEALHSGRVSAAVWSVERALPAQREDPTIQLGTGGTQKFVFEGGKGGKDSGNEQLNPLCGIRVGCDTNPDDGTDADFDGGAIPRQSHCKARR